MNRPTVGVVGGGILGMTAALRLAQHGVKVCLYERSPDLGGLVGSFDFDGRAVDRFYHVNLPTDDRVLGLAEELGLRDRFRFRPTKVGFYGDGRLFSMTSPKEFLTFPLLSMPDRIRLAAFVARCQLTKTHDELDAIPLVEWLERTSGRKVTERLWKPLLDSKFDGRFDDLPATYIWARTRRMSKTRDKSGAEIMGWLEGGYTALIDAIERRIRELGGEVHAGTQVDRIAGGSDGVTGLLVDGRYRPFDHVLCTLAPPQAATVLAPELKEHAHAERFRYLGVVCLLLRTKQSLSPYYHLNITDRRVPLTTIVETTHVVDPDYVGGHLVYITRYVEPGHELHERSPDEIEAEFLRHARTIFPELTDDVIVSRKLQRARITEPVHLLGGAANIPDLFPAPGLAMASLAHVYPEISSGQATIGVTDRVVPGILERLQASDRVAAAA
jgi:protoporphyrinogen oxidase